MEASTVVDWLLNLPVVWMAAIVFAATYFIAGVLGLVITTHPSASPDLIAQCARRGIPRVWLHRSFGHGSVSADAVREAERLGVECIVGGCPLMFCEPVDFGHRCMRWWLQHRGQVPR